MSTLRVLTFNIHTGIGMDGKYNLERIAQTIEAAEVDLVGLQEVENRYRSATNFDDQTAWLAERLGWNSIYGPAVVNSPAPGLDQNREFGVALLSPYRLNNERIDVLEPDDRVRADEVRVLLSADLHWETSASITRMVRAAVTHFDHVEPLQRLTQAKQTAQILAQEKYPTVLMGDMNSVPSNPEIKALREQLNDASESWEKQTGHGVRGSFPATTPIFQIDYVFYRGFSEVAEYKVLTGQASDHRAVKVSLNL